MEKVMGIMDGLYKAYNKVDRDLLDRSNVCMHNWGHVKSIHSADKKHSDLGTAKAIAVRAITYKSDPVSLKNGTVCGVYERSNTSS